MQTDSVFILQRALFSPQEILGKLPWLAEGHLTACQRRGTAGGGQLRASRGLVSHVFDEYRSGTQFLHALRTAT